MGRAPPTLPGIPNGPCARGCWAVSDEHRLGSSTAGIRGMELEDTGRATLLGTEQPPTNDHHVLRLRDTACVHQTTSRLEAAHLVSGPSF